MTDRRSLLTGSAAGLALLASPALRAQALEPVVLVTPGPGSSVSAIPELALRIGADRAEGLAVRLKFAGGGGVAIREMRSGNASFGVFGLTAAMNENLAGIRLVGLAAVEDLVPLSLMVRPALKGRVRRLADLKGLAVGVHSASLALITNSQQFLTLLLRQAGLNADSVRIVAAGQSWESQSAALRSGVIDAIVSEEPFGLRLDQAGLAFPLVRIGRPGQPAGLPGEGFLRGTLMTTPALIQQDPRLAERMVRMIQRTLAWRLENSPAEFVARLGLEGPEAVAFGTMLRDYPRQFSADGRFSEAQLAQTERFFRESSDNAAPAQALQLSSMLVDRWAGRKP